MMASLLKLLCRSRPRLQFLVLMLVLGAGLLPKNSMAQDEPPADAPASSAADASATVAPVPTNASGRADSSGKSVKCYQSNCIGVTEGERDNALFGALFKSPEECMKLPDKDQGVSCESGYCYQSIIQAMRSGKTVRFHVTRGCAHAAQVTCLATEQGSCIHPSGHDGLTSDEVDKKLSDNKKCQRQNGYSPSLLEARSDEGTSGVRIDLYSAIRCVCKDKDFCNDRTSSGPTGAKHLGYNAALLGALLVVVFSLRTMFLVG